MAISLKKGMDKLPPPDFTSNYTDNFPAILRELGVSLLVSTYQAGKLIIVRADGDALNTHFRSFASPMGVAYQAGTGRCSIGTKDQVWHFHNHPELASKLPPVGTHDAAFLPRRSHFSGDIRIHEIGWVDDELWAVNTRFSCLCTFDDIHSFVPRWRPSFITALAPEDRCHLNGMAIIDNRVKYVTCLGQSDTAGGWRANKASGGIMLDVETGEIVLSGLSMPHSPRFYAGHHWILESGIGSFSEVHLQSGTTNAITRLPGFTRGIDFYSHFAFIGLSQVRETAVFSDIPLVNELKERTCGVWMIDLRNGRTVAFLRFEGAVQEIFAVQVLPGVRFPDVINESGPLISSSFVLPNEALHDVDPALRQLSA